MSFSVVLTAEYIKRKEILLVLQTNFVVFRFDSVHHQGVYALTRDVVHFTPLSRLFSHLFDVPSHELISDRRAKLLMLINASRRDIVIQSLEMYHCCLSGQSKSRTNRRSRQREKTKHLRALSQLNGKEVHQDRKREKKKISTRLRKNKNEEDEEEKPT